MFNIFNCPFCGSIYLNPNFLCEVCHDRLFESLKPSERVLKGDQVVSALFEWIPNKNDLLSRAALRWKGCEDPNLWEDYAEKIIEWEDLSNVHKIVPIPTKRPTNHSLGLAKALSRSTGLPVCEALGLSIRGGVEVKDLNLNQREHLMKDAYVIREQIPLNDEILLIDDIVTSGTTLGSALNALKRVNKTRIWTIATRSLAVD